MLTLDVSNMPCMRHRSPLIKIRRIRLVGLCNGSISSESAYIEMSPAVQDNPIIFHRADNKHEIAEKGSDIEISLSASYLSSIDF